MGAIPLTSALFADIIFLPALLNRFAKPPPSRAGSTASPEAREPAVTTDGSG